MAQVDLKKNRESILLAHKQISDAKNANNWALFGYEGNTNVLKVVTTGDDGIEGLVDELSGGKIMYAYCRILDPNTQLPKFVLINWTAMSYNATRVEQGEGVPEIRKGACAHHTRDVANILRGAHVTINARTEEDVDEDAIRQKVASASGCNYSVHREKKPAIPDKITPVGSVYKRTVANINSSARDQFWEKTQVDDKKWRDVSRQKSIDEQRTLDTDRRAREETEAKQRDSRESDRLRHIRDLRVAERRADTSAPSQVDKELWEKSQREAVNDDAERRKRSEVMRRDRAAEAKSLVGQRETNPMDRFRQRSQFDDDDDGSAPSRQAAPPSRKLQQSFTPTAASDAVLPPADRPSSPPAAVAPAKPARNSAGREPSPEPAVAREPFPEPVVAREPAPEPVVAREPSPEPVVAREPSPELQRKPLPPSPPGGGGAGPQTRNLMAMGLPPRQDSDEEEEDDQNWDEPPTEDFSAPTSPPPQQPAPQTLPPAQQTMPPPAKQGSREEKEEMYGDVAPGRPAVAGGGEGGPSAKAVYDYQAEAEDEISFDPDDIVTDIDQVDDGWWVGTAPNGHRGMFPANFVELI